MLCVDVLWIGLEVKCWLPGYYQTNKALELTRSAASLALSPPLAIAFWATKASTSHTLPAALPFPSITKTWFMSVSSTRKTRFLSNVLNKCFAYITWLLFNTHPFPLQERHLFLPIPPHKWHIRRVAVLGTSICETWFWKRAVGCALMSHTLGVSKLLLFSRGPPK